MASNLSTDESEFNYAVKFLGRMDLLFFQADTSSMGLDSFAWYHTLLAIRRELADDMTDDEIKRSDGFRLRILPKMHLQTNQRNRGQYNYCHPELYEDLDEFEIFLRRVFKRAGYKTKLKDDPRFAR